MYFFKEVNLQLANQQLSGYEKKTALHSSSNKTVFLAASSFTSRKIVGKDQENVAASVS